MKRTIPAAPAIVTRTGTIYLAPMVADHAIAPPDLIKKLGRALEDQPTVTRVSQPAAETVDDVDFYPRLEAEPYAGLDPVQKMFPTDRPKCPRLKTPMTIVWDHPAGCVGIWDLATLMIYRAEEPGTVIDSRDGTAIIDSITRAVKTTGYQYRVKEPTLCRVTLYISYGPSRSFGCSILDPEARAVEMLLPGDGLTNASLAIDAFTRLEPVVAVFYRLCNTRDMILKITKSTGDVEELLRIQYEATPLPAWPTGQRVAQVFNGFGWRRRARRLINHIGLATARIERLRLEWNSTRREYGRRTVEGNLNLLFNADLDSYQNDLQLIGQWGAAQHTIEQVATGLNNRAVVIAIIGGALAGGAAGAVAAYLIHPIGH
jgi:hypothetical protein